jgi:hypothetical protein
MTRPGRFVPVATAAAVLVMIAELLASPLMRGPLDGAALAHRSEGYTSVEIVDHLQLPAQVESGGQLVLRVRLVNREGTAKVYALTQTLVAGAERWTVPPVPVALADGASTVVPVKFTMPRCAGRILTQVALKGRFEAVRVWVTARSTERAVRACG